MWVDTAFPTKRWGSCAALCVPSCLLLQISFMFVEAVVGWAKNSLGLISDAGHMAFDNLSIFIGLYASYMAQWKPNGLFSYG